MKKDATEFTEFRRAMDRMESQMEKRKIASKKWNKFDKQHKSNKKEYLKEVESED